jgi:hypothetical protein
MVGIKNRMAFGMIGCCGNSVEALLINYQHLLEGGPPSKEVLAHGLNLLFAGSIQSLDSGKVTQSSGFLNVSLVYNDSPHDVGIIRTSIGNFFAIADENDVKITSNQNECKVSIPKKLIHRTKSAQLHHQNTLERTLKALSLQNIVLVSVFNCYTMTSVLHNLPGSCAALPPYYIAHCLEIGNLESLTPHGLQKYLEASELQKELKETLSDLLVQKSDRVSSDGQMKLNQLLKAFGAATTPHGDEAKKAQREAACKALKQKLERILKFGVSLRSTCPGYDFPKAEDWDAWLSIMEVESVRKKIGALCKDGIDVRTVITSKSALTKTDEKFADLCKRVSKDLGGPRCISELDAALESEEKDLGAIETKLEDQYAIILNGAWSVARNQHMDTLKDDIKAKIAFSEHLKIIVPSVSFTGFFSSAPFSAVQPTKIPTNWFQKWANSFTEKRSKGGDAELCFLFSTYRVEALEMMLSDEQIKPESTLTIDRIIKDILVGQLQHYAVNQIQHVADVKRILDIARRLTSIENGPPSGLAELDGVEEPLASTEAVPQTVKRLVSLQEKLQKRGSCLIAIWPQLEQCLPKLDFPILDEAEYFEEFCSETNVVDPEDLLSKANSIWNILEVPGDWLAVLRHLKTLCQTNVGKLPEFLEQFKSVCARVKKTETLELLLEKATGFVNL